MRATPLLQPRPGMSYFAAGLAHPCRVNTRLCSRLWPLTGEIARVVGDGGGMGVGSEVGEAEVEVADLDAAVHLEHLPGDEAARRRRQVEHGEGDVLGLAEPAQRRLLHHLGPQLVG